MRKLLFREACLFAVGVLLLAMLAELIFSQDVGPLAAERTLTGKCVRVVDGDTIDVVVTTFGDRPETSTYRVRLAYIDAPEKSQEYGDKALQYLKSQALQQTVRVTYTQRDRYDRIIGEVTVARPTKHHAIKAYDKSTLNDHMLAFGWAWQYRQYDKDAWRAELQEVARKNREGLWKGKAPIPPWEFRKAKKKLDKAA